MAKNTKTAITFFVGGCEDFKQEIRNAGVGGQVDNYSFLGDTLKEATESIVENSLDQLNLNQGDIVYEVTVRPVGKINIGITPLKTS